MLKKTIDLLLYSNVFIALCAVSLLWTSELMTYSKVVVTPYHGIIFFASLFVYSSHRLVGIHKLKADKINKRHFLVHQIEKLVIALGAIGLIGAIFLFFGLSTMQQVLMIIPGVVALGYVIPFSRKGLRLRDYPFIKIFLIAFTWAWVTVIVPLWEMHPDGIWWLYFERFFFIFAITLPFDIRDLVLDKAQNTKTLALILGVEKTRRLSFFVLGFSLIIGIVYLLVFSLQYTVVNGYLMAGLYSFYFLNEVRKEASDYLFTGWLDGTMIAQFVIIQLFIYFS